MADEAKAKGNQAFSAGNFNEAIKFFSEAIALAPENHVLYSNRSASYASLKNYPKALEDAKKTVEIQPSWAKGYNRLGAAYVGLGDYSEAIRAYKNGLQHDPNNASLKEALAEAESHIEEEVGGINSIAKLFQRPDLFSKLRSDSKTRDYMNQPDFVEALRMVQTNPNMINLYLKDPRFMTVLGVLLNIDLQMRSPEDMETNGSFSRAPPSAAESKPEPVPEPEPMPVDELDPEEKEKRDKKENAKKEKELGNAAYKKKDFELAIKHYTTALELDDEDITFLTNRAAVYFEMTKWDDCIADCDAAVEKGRSLHSDYKLIARALTRKGSAFVKMAKVSKDFEPAIEAFNKALTEHRNPDTLKRLNEAEKAKKELEAQEYYDPSIAEQEREKGNEKFKSMLYPEAVKHYSEAIKRNPKDAKSYSNRAASYTKLGALPEALKDAEKCIEIDPSFAKGYLRKANAQYFMKEYDKAMATYNEGLRFDPSNQELLDGIRNCMDQVRRTSRGDVSADELKERQAKALQDPEIQNILSDPIMRQVLNDFQENPTAALQHQKNPMIMAKISKLMMAGIIQVR